MPSCIANDTLNDALEAACQIGIYAGEALRSFYSCTIFAANGGVELAYPLVTASKLFSAFEQRLSMAKGQATCEMKHGRSNDLVTSLDRTIESIISDFLLEQFPHFRFLGEEGTLVTGADKEQSASAPIWIVDPIDGTTNFVHRLGLSAISIALVSSSGVPLLGMIYHPALRQLYSAIKDQGAFMNRTHRLHVRDNVRSLRDALIVTEFSTEEASHANLLSKLQQMRSDLIALPTRGIRCFGSAALNLAFVASGTCDLFYEFGIHAWDIAAGLLLVKEAGGIVGHPWTEEQERSYLPSFIINDRSFAMDIKFRNVLAAASPDIVKEFKKKILAGNEIAKDLFSADPLEWTERN